MTKKLMFLITEDWFFKSHFMERAIAASDAGYNVFVATRISNPNIFGSCDKFSIIPIGFQRSGLNPFRDLYTLFQIIQAYRMVAPDVIHQVAMKPIIYGTIARMILNLKSKIINAPVGMGYVFTSSEAKAAFLRPIVHSLLKVTLNPQNSKVVFENPDDLYDAVEDKIVKENDAVLIQGAGVDTNIFKPLKCDNDIPVVTLVARMLVDKGINEFIEAAKIINRRSIVAVFNLVGDPDSSNPASLESSYLQGLSGQFGLYWRGFSKNIAEVYQKSDIACLPSYREGLPKSLIEAAACGLPIVSTDAVGCREVVVHEINGLLVPIKSPTSLANAISRLIVDHDLRIRMGIESRRLAIARFSSEIVIGQTLGVYK